MNADERRLNEITEKIIGCAFAVSNRMGCGYLEKVYLNYLKATGLTVCLLINFAKPRIEIKRIVNNF